ncbi:MAG: hypothetical protein IJ832_01595 [Bacteroidaceae bacterium]|nr:hypothetical protein [Bacteroidaceae bacterium]
MKKIILIAIAAFGLMACGEQNKYDAALDQYEDLIDQTIEAIKNGDQTAADNLNRKITDIGPTIQEIDTRGTSEQKKRKTDLEVKFVRALFQGVNPNDNNTDIDRGQMGEITDDADE